MGYVHCALTPPKPLFPVRVTPPAPPHLNGGLVVPNSIATLEGTSLQLYTTVACTVCRHHGPYCFVRVQTEDVPNGPNLPTPLALPSPSLPPLPPSTPVRGFVMSHTKVLGFDKRLRLAVIFIYLSFWLFTGNSISKQKKQQRTFSCGVGVGGAPCWKFLFLSELLCLQKQVAFSCMCSFYFF